ncbi:hypothetical protein OAB54_02495 [Flavobacteriaceae bacterium]|nr:hypothetical protein [Flavobacteriaceae bacterium]
MNLALKNVSIFYHDKMGKIEFKAIKVFVDNYLEKYIELNELLGTVNEFINYKNPKKDNTFNPEDKLMSLKSLLNIAGVEKPHHIEIFEDIAFDHINSAGSAKERAIIIHDAWRVKALQIRDNDFK